MSISLALRRSQTAQIRGTGWEDRSRPPVRILRETEAAVTPTSMSTVIFSAYTPFRVDTV
eukprot:161965-Prorocentrum_minimum.AAC.2